MSQLSRFDHRIAVILAYLAILPGASALHAAGPATAPSGDNRIGQLIQLLGSPDPTERDEAQATLVQIGEPSRAALIAAQNGDDPAIAQAAAAIILQLPWYTADDPPEIRRILDGYGARDVAERCTVAGQLGSIPDTGWKVMARIVAQEPSDIVRWQMVNGIASQSVPARWAAARSVAVSSDSPPLLILAGWGWKALDTVKATDYLQRAFDLWKAAPGNFDPGELSFLFLMLDRNDMLLHRDEQAADLTRAEIHQHPGKSSLLFKLFALHAQSGPFKGYADDLAMAGDAANSPLLLYCQSRIALKMMLPENADSLRLRAMNAAGASAWLAYDTGIALADRGWDDLALPQLNAFLSMPPIAGDRLAAEAWLRIGRIYARRGDYSLAADAQGTVVRSFAAGTVNSLDYIDPEFGNAHNEDSTAAEVDWHLSMLEVAKDKHDAAGITRELDALVALNPDNSDAVLEIVPVLAACGRNAEAQPMFDRAYRERRADVDSTPWDPWSWNVLAWYCAMCGQHLQEADAAARRAVALQPTDANDIDTLAECEYRLGRPLEAVRLETIALSIDHNRFSLIEQLDRFRAAAAQAGH
jgi:tetratricopeptide (TPR) repeat protein